MSHYYDCEYCNKDWRDCNCHDLVLQGAYKWIVFWVNADGSEKKAPTSSHQAARKIMGDLLANGTTSWIKEIKDDNNK